MSRRKTEWCASAAPGLRRREFPALRGKLECGLPRGRGWRSQVVAAVRQTDAPSGKPFSRQKAAGIIADARKIVTPNGIERLQAVRIGGIEQWVSVRGMDKGNPALLFFTAARATCRFP